VLHFCGIGSAALGAPPQPWLINQTWCQFYRPYLEFMYLNNAYRYYSPEPGPPSLLWFRVEYTEGNLVHSRWLYLPDMDTEKGRHRYPLGLIYQRRLSLTQNTEPSLPPPSMMERAPDGAPRMNKVYEQRIQNAPQDVSGPVPLGRLGPVPSDRRLIVPFHPEFRPESQYQAPSFYPKHLLSSYARHVLTLPHPKHPDAKVKSVKVYRVVHAIMPMLWYAQGRQPTDMTLYLPYYMGEFDVEGKLTAEAKQDPFLYWMLPNLRDDVTNPEKSVIRSYYRRHAGDRDWVLYPDKTWHEE
jgi:hypothetical protein